MTARAPLVLGSNGLPQQLQAGDTITGGGGGGVNLVASLPAATSGNRANLEQLESNTLGYNGIILLDNPVFFVPGSDTVGTTVAVNLGSDGYTSTGESGVVFGISGGCADGSTAFSLSGAANNAINFSQTLLTITSDFTFEIGAYFTGGGSVQAFFNLGGNGLILFYDGTHIGFYNNFTSTSTGWTPTRSTWYLLQFVYVASTHAWTLYANNVSVATGTFTMTSPSSGSGIGGGGGNNSCSGVFQKAAGYASALGTTAISNHYTAWTGGVYTNDALYISLETSTSTYVMAQIYDKLNYPQLASVGAYPVNGIGDLNGVAGLDLWLAARKISSPPSSGSALTSWPDASGNGRNYTGVNNPIYNTNQIGGQPSVAFNGSNQYFKPAVVYDPTGKMTIFLVVKYSSGSPFSNAKIPSASGGMTYGNDSGQHLFQASNGGSWPAFSYATQGLIDTGNYQLIALRIGYGMLQMCVNGIPCISATVSSNPIVGTGDPTYGLLLGVLNNNGSFSGYMNGSIAEFAVYTKVLSEFWWAYIQNYLTSLYQIPT